MRELLGKKLTGRLRKDLDDISEKTNIPLKSCRRQVGCHSLGQKQDGGAIKLRRGHDCPPKGANDFDSCECFQVKSIDIV